MASLGFENLVKDLFIKSLYRWASVVGLLGVYILAAVWLTADPAYYPLQTFLPPEAYQTARYAAFLLAGGIVLSVFLMRRRVATPERLRRFVSASTEWDALTPALNAGEPRALAVVQDLLARDVTFWGLTGWVALVGVTLFILSGQMMDLTLYTGIAGTALVLIRPSMPRVNTVLERYRSVEREHEHRASGQAPSSTTYTSPSFTVSVGGDS